MKKSEMATRIRELENNFVELCALHNHAERLLREWVEECDELRKRVAQLESRPQLINNSLRSTLPERLAYSNYSIAPGRMSDCTPDVQQQIRDMSVDE